MVKEHGVPATVSSVETTVPFAPSLVVKTYPAAEKDPLAGIPGIAIVPEYVLDEIARGARLYVICVPPFAS